MEYLFRGGVYTTSVEYLSIGGGYTTSVECLSRGGGTPPQWNINPQGGGYPSSVEYFSQPPIFPNAPFSTLFFSFGGGCSPVLHGLPFFPTFNFMMVFLWWVAVLGEGECQTFSCPFLSGRKEGRGRVPHFYQTFAEMCSVLCP